MLVTQLHTEKNGTVAVCLSFPRIVMRMLCGCRTGSRNGSGVFREAAAFSCAPAGRRPVPHASDPPFCGLRRVVCTGSESSEAKIRNLSIFATGLSECAIRRPEKLTKGNLLCLVGFVFFSARLLFVSFEPLFAGQLLHVGHQVLFVGDFLAEQGLEDILEGDDTLEAAVFVEDDADLFLA